MALGRIGAAAEPVVALPGISGLQALNVQALNATVAGAR